MAEIVVSNSSPLIALSQIQQLDLLLQLYGRVHVPPAVLRETIQTVRHPPSWIIETPLSQAIDPRIQSRGLGDGESETLSLALELGASVAIVDEKAGRLLALAVGVPVVGTLGILTSARKNGHLALLRPLLDALKQHRFYISSQLYEDTLRMVGELP